MAVRKAPRESFSLPRANWHVSSPIGCVCECFFLVKPHLGIKTLPPHLPLTFARTSTRREPWGSRPRSHLPPCPASASDVSFLRRAKNR